jgi:hypothetical protein
MICLHPTAKTMFDDTKSCISAGEDRQVQSLGVEYTNFEGITLRQSVASLGENRQ